MTERSNDRDRASRSLSLGSLGIGIGTAATACVPAVSSTLVSESPQAPDRPLAETDLPRSSGPDLQAPRIIAAELVGNAKLRIHFSEAVVTPESFNPADFRISMLRVTSNGSYSSAYYYEPGTHYYGVPLVHKGLLVDGDTVEIEFSSYLPPAFCRSLEYGGQFGRVGESVAGLFLHYAAGPIPLEDEAGNALLSFGVSWVMGGREQPPQTQATLDGEQAQRAGRDLVRISCGPPIPPGPR